MFIIAEGGVLYFQPAHCRAEDAAPAGLKAAIAELVPVALSPEYCRGAAKRRRTVLTHLLVAAREES